MDDKIYDENHPQIRNWRSNLNLWGSADMAMWTWWKNEGFFVIYVNTNTRLLLLFVFFKFISLLWKCILIWSSIVMEMSSINEFMYEHGWQYGHDDKDFRTFFRNAMHVFERRIVFHCILFFSLTIIFKARFDSDSITFHYK